jgi:hypothetical protein
MKRAMFYKIWVIIFLATACISCKKGVDRGAAAKIVAEWTGREIIFPAGVPCIYQGRDTVCPGGDTPYKILLYTDSAGCTTCKLQLYKWITLMKEAEEEMPGKIGFHFYFQPKDKRELLFILQQDNFRQIVYADSGNLLHRTNRLPDKASYQCFLLDSNNRVLLVGNPAHNFKIWDLYRQTVMETGSTEQQQEKMPHTTVEVEQPEIELQNTRAHETSTGVFIIKNTGDVPLVIKDISASCGCTVPEWDKRPVKPGDKTEITVKVTPDDAGYFRKTVTVFCNTEKGAVLLAVKSMVKK